MISRRTLAFVLAVGCAATASVCERARAAELPPPPGPPAASFDVGTLHVDRYGRGPQSVVLVPGLEVGPWEWFGVIPHLAQTRRVYVVTLPGFDGRPPAATPPGQLFATTEKDLAALVVRERLARPVIVGHSLGGTIAIGFAEAYPTVPGGVVSVDALPVTLALAYQPADELKRQADSAAGNFAALVDPASVRRFMLQNVATTGAVSASAMDGILAREVASNHATATNDLRELLETDLRSGLGKIAAPLLVLVPYYLPDNSTPPDISPPIVFERAAKVAAYRAVLQGVRQLSLVPIEPARHFIMLDAPAAFEHALDAFLAAPGP